MLMLLYRKAVLLAIKRAYSGSPSNVRVRFAPSPTGHMHLGGLRTAFYNYLFSRKHKGKFILRIEDTDQKRIMPGSMDNLNSALEWIGLIPDESPKIGGDYGPYMQSQRLPLYKEKAAKLLETNAAYRCFCSEDRLAIMRKEKHHTRQIRGYDNKCRYLQKDEIDDLLKKGTPYTIRFKISEGPITHQDIIYGAHTYDLSKNEGDFVILKSDGFPTYHFACVVDDHMMQITHVLRGMEWLISTPKHIMLHHALGFQPPQFAHLPLLVNSDRTKLSKRQESIGIEHFKNKGYSSLALLNFLAVAGGGFGRQDGCYVCSLEDLCSKFNLEYVNTHSCIVDLPKLDNFNQDHLVKCISDDSSLPCLIKEFRSLLHAKYGRCGYEEKNIPDSYIKQVLFTYKERINVLGDLVTQDMKFLWTLIDPEDILQKLNRMEFSHLEASALKKLKDILDSYPESEFTENHLGSRLREISKDVNISYMKFMLLLRTILTNQKDGPKVAEIFSFLGKQRSLQRICTVIERLEKK